MQDVQRNAKRKLHVMFQYQRAAKNVYHMQMLEKFEGSK